MPHIVWSFTIATLTNSFLAMCVLLVGAQASADEPKELSADMQGEVKDDSFRMYWAPNRWPVELRGYNVKRRSLKENGEWVKVNSSIIEHGLSPNKDLSNVEPDEQERNRLRESFSSFGTTPEILRQLQELFIDGKPTPKLTERLYFGFVYRANVNFNFAMSGGLGIVDRSMSKDEYFDYEYGLFPVYVSGERGLIAKFRPVRLSSKSAAPLSLKMVRNEKDRMLIRWQMTKTNFDQLSVYGFHVHLASRNQEPRLLTDRLGEARFILPGIADDEGNLHFQYALPRDIDKDVEYRVTVAAITGFGTEFEGQATIKQTPSESKLADTLGASGRSRD